MNSGTLKSKASCTTKIADVRCKMTRLRSITLNLNYNYDRSGDSAEHYAAAIILLEFTATFKRIAVYSTNIKRNYHGKEQLSAKMGMIISENGEIVGTTATIAASGLCVSGLTN